MNSRFFLVALIALSALLLVSPVQAQSPQATPPPPPPPTLTAPQGKVAPPPGPVDIASEPSVRVVTNVQPAVVNINAEQTVPQYVTYYDGFFRRYRGVINHTSQSIGSGLIISADGYVITNQHVVALADQDKPVGVTLVSGSKYRARIVAADEEQDLALLKIEDKAIQFPYFDLSYVSPNLLGETVLALGCPEGFQNSVSKGILSAKGRAFTVEGHNYTNLIQTDAAINPGNSGGPLVDLNGSLVGINSAKLSGQAVENIGFAIPHEIVVSWANQALAEARGEKSAGIPSGEAALQALQQHLGFRVEPLSPQKAANQNLQINGGLLITGVEKGSPAAAANLQQGMIVVAINDREVVDTRSIPHRLKSLKAGDKVELQVIFVQQVGPITLQRGGSATLVAR